MEIMQILIVMIVYLIIVTLFGFYHGRKVKTGSDFNIADRKLPGWVAALSERSTGESSWALLGLPGAAYATGLLEAWTAIGCVLGVILAWSFIALRLRDEAEKYQVDSFTDYIARRHGEMGKWIRIIGSLVIVFFFFFYVGAQFIGGGKTLENLFGIHPIYGMLFIVVLVVPYTVYGGFRSVTYTDVVQAIVMIIALIITPIAGIIYLANSPENAVYANSISEALVKAGSQYSSLAGGLTIDKNSELYAFLLSIFPNSIDVINGLGSGIMAVGAFSWFFGYLGGQPQLSMRFMAITNRRQAIFGKYIGIVWTIIAYLGALSIGWIGLAIFGPQALKDQESVMPEVLKALFHPIMVGILITGILAAIISTANSLLILSSTEFSENILKTKKQLTQKQKLFKARVVTAAFAVVAFVLAYFSPDKLIYTIVSFVWSGIGCTFSVVIIFTLFWKRYHSWAALLTIIIGVAFTIIWIISGMEKIITSRFMTFVVAALVGIITTYAINGKKKAS